MKPLKRATFELPSKFRMKEQAKALGMSLADIRAQYRAIASEEEIWRNDDYVVLKRDFEHLHLGKCVHLSIRRDDREPVSDWRDKQAIKNQLVGPECEGLELYPAESRLMDSANQYHLWVVCDPTSRVPFGWTERDTFNESIGGSMQRPLEEMQT